MSLAQELNELGEYGYIRISDLPVGKKFKVIELKPYNSQLNGLNRICVRVDLEKGFLILPERYDKKVDTLSSANVENLYVAYNGKKANRADIVFSEQKAE